MLNIYSKKICIIGDGWAAKAAIDGVSKIFKNIIVITNDDKIQKEIKLKKFYKSNSIYKVQADIYICAGFLKKIKKRFVNNNQVWNIHYSLLPKYRGRHSVIWSILNNETKFGLTIHRMNEYIDDGPIIYQYKFSNLGQTSRQVIERCNSHIKRHLAKILKRFLLSKVKLKNQNRSKATWFYKRNYEDCIINFNYSVLYTKFLFRALVDPYPLPRIKIKKYILEIIDFKLIKKKSHITIGSVMTVENNKVWIKLKDGFLILRKVRDASSKKNIRIDKIFKVGMKLK
jgi:methionyl-tRNA formyltransferase